MYRHIDVIFRHPTKKFTVIYQDGVLWQLPRFEITAQSLQNKKRYLGSRKEIFVASNQRPNENDPFLAEQLFTINLPNAVVGRDVDEFDHWWRYNWSKYSEVVMQKTGTQETGTQKIIQQNLDIKSSDHGDIPNATSTSVVFSSPTAISNTVPSHASNPIDDLLEHMLDDLLNQ